MSEINDTERRDRRLDTRADNMRNQEWKPSRLLPEPPFDDDVDYRWVRSKMRGVDDSANVSRKLREGWEPVPKTQDVLDSMRMICDIKSNYPDYIESSGNILMRRAKSISRQASKFMAQKAQDQIDAVDNDLMKLNDSRMPLFNNSRTDITYGKGRKG